MQCLLNFLFQLLPFAVLIVDALKSCATALFDRVTICSYIERRVIARETGRVAPISMYPLLTLCLLASSSLSNLALNFINFPTKVVFRSCKLIPTMVVATIVHKKIFSSIEYICALAACSGLVCFAAADWQLTPSFHPIGIILVSLSVFADSILPNAQERLFRLGSSRLEVTFFTNIFTLLAMTVTTLLSGDLLGLLDFARNKNTLLTYMFVYTFVAYIAISIHMTVVKRFGGVAAVVLATGRKGMTLILSFVLFPKAFSWLYVLGATLVLGGLLVSSLARIYGKKKADTAKQNAAPNLSSQLKEDADLEQNSLLNSSLLSINHAEELKTSPGALPNGLNHAHQQ